MMSQLCYICNEACQTDVKNSRFIDKAWNDRMIVDLVSEIIEEPIIPEKLHSDVLCNKCYDTCIFYETSCQKMKTLKAETQLKFKKTLSLNNISYDSYLTESPTKSPMKNGMKVVVPASKLMPCPPDMLAKVEKALALGNTRNSFRMENFTAFHNSKLIQLKKTQPLTSISETINQSLPKIIETQSLKLESIGSIDQSSILSSNTSTMSFETMNFSSLPKDFLEKNTNDDDGDGDKSDDDENNDDQVGVDDILEGEEVGKDDKMHVHHTNNGFIQVYIENDKNVISGDKRNFLDLNLLTSTGDQDSSNKFIVGNLQLPDDDDDDENDTIVMDSENGSILRVVSGNKLMYGDEIAVAEYMMPQNDDGQSQDSNEESQIELQVSGDEETANAIIAAAQEQGGAFIKVGSGEMFRVKSVESKNKSDDEEENSEDRQLTDYLVKIENGKFNCLMCKTEYGGGGGATGLSAEGMMRHARARHQARLYVCRVCHHLTRRKASHTLHMEKHSNEITASTQNTVKNKVHECNTCNKRYSSKTLLSEHMNAHNGTRPHTCDICQKTFISKYTFQAHLKTHTNRPRPYKCNQCGKSFLSNQNLLQHEKTHLGIKDFRCKICDKRFGSQHNLEIHGVVHSGQKPFVCNHCNKGFARRAELADHIRTHTGERPFSCSTCGASFSQRSNLLSHRRATHMDDRRYPCTSCNKKFKRRRLLDYHTKASHTGERPLTCEICSASFVYPEHYKKHLRIHSGDKPYVCEVCGKSFNSRDNRNTHRFVHSDKKPYECLVCSAGYMRKNLLYAHMNSTGHLAESIVVNQPRVSKVTDNVVSTESLVVDSIKMRPDQIAEAMMSNQDIQLEMTSKTMETDQIHVKTETDFLEVITAEQLERAQIVANDENGEMVRLVQIQLPDGNNGWVAINP